MGTATIASRAQAPQVTDPRVADLMQAGKIRVGMHSLTAFTAQKGHAEKANETFLGLVKSKITLICAAFPIPTCENDFESCVRFAEWLDAEEERAIMLEKSGDEPSAKKLRFEILQHAALLDIHVESIRSQHRTKQFLS